MFVGALGDKTLIVLCISAVVSIILGLAFEDPKTGWIEGTAILMAVFIVATVTSANDYSKVQHLFLFLFLFFVFISLSFFNCCGLGTKIPQIERHYL
jgi:hypothetical protein